MKRLQLTANILLTSMLPLGFFVHASVAMEDAIGVNAELEALLAMGQDADKRDHARVDAYTDVIDQSNQNLIYQGYFKQAIEGLLAMGNDPGVEDFTRCMAYRQFLKYCEDNDSCKEYSSQAMKDILAVLESPQLCEENGLINYEKILEFCKDSKDLQPYFKQVIETLLISGENPLKKPSDRSSGYSTVLEYCAKTQSYERYFKQAVEGLLVMGKNLEFDSKDREWWYKKILFSCENKENYYEEYLKETIEDLFVLGEDSGRSNTIRFRTFSGIFNYCKKIKNFSGYLNRSVEGLLATVTDDPVNIRDITYFNHLLGDVLQFVKDKVEYSHNVQPILEYFLAVSENARLNIFDRRNAASKAFHYCKKNDVESSYLYQALINYGILDPDGARTYVFNFITSESLAFIQGLFNHHAFSSFLGNLDRSEKERLLRELITREYGDRSFGPIVERFEAISGLRRDNFYRTNTGVEQCNLYDASNIVDIYREEGVAAVEAYLDNRALMGVVTSRGLGYDSIVRVGSKRMQEDSELVIAYVTEEIIEALSIERFSGLLFPGSGDNYPGHLSEFTLEDMPEDGRSINEKLYQKVYAMAKAASVPTFGICAGAQHLVLSRGGSLMKNKNYNADVNVPMLTPLHYMMLSNDEQRMLLETCEAKDFRINVFRAHSYAGVSGKLGEGVELAVIDGETPLAFTHGFEAFGTQFHPEGRYQGVSQYASNDGDGRQTNLLNFFFEICKAQHRFVEAAKERGETREEGIAQLRAYMGGILNRLKECKAGREVAGEMSWEEEIF